MVWAGVFTQYGNVRSVLFLLLPIFFLWKGGTKVLGINFNVKSGKGVEIWRGYWEVYAIQTSQI